MWMSSIVKRHVVAYNLCVGEILQRGKSDGKAVAFLTDIPRSGMMGQRPETLPLILRWRKRSAISGTDTAR